MGKRRNKKSKKGARAPQPHERESAVLEHRETDNEASQANNLADHQSPQAHPVESQTTTVPREPRPVVVDGSSANFQALLNQGYYINWDAALMRHPGPMAYAAPMHYGIPTMNMPMGYGFGDGANSVVGYGLPGLTYAPSIYGPHSSNSTPPDTGFMTMGDPNWMFSTRAPSAHPLVPVANGGGSQPMGTVSHDPNFLGSGIGVNQAPGVWVPYDGDMNNSANIPPEQSTSLMIENLPPGCTEKRLLDLLCLFGPFGKVYKAHVVAGGPGYNYPTCLGKISMWTREAAEAVYDFVQRGNLVVDGYFATVKWDPKLVAEVRGQRPHVSRVLRVGGPASIVNENNLGQYSSRKLFYTTQNIETTFNDGEVAQMVWTFSSFHAQATGAMRALKREWPELYVGYGVDPMAEGNASAAMLNSGSVLPLS